MFVITAIAVVGLDRLRGLCRGLFDAGNLPDIPPTDAVGRVEFLPFGVAGVWAAVPYAIWFFLAVEGVPLAAEEAREPEQNMPRGIIAACSSCIVTGAAVLFLATGRCGPTAMSTSGNPLVEALGDADRGQGRQLRRARRPGR